MSGHFCVVLLVLATAEPDVALVVQYEVGGGTGDQEVGTDVELPTLQQQGVLNVSINRCRIIIKQMKK